MATSGWLKFLGWMINPIGKAFSHLGTKGAQKATNDQLQYASDGESGFSNWFARNMPGFNSLWNRWTGNALTNAETQANDFNAAEADKQRQWEEYMQSTNYQRMVADMQAAGVNPALAMSNGQPSTPSGSSAQSVSPGAGASMSDLMQLIMLPSQIKLMNAQARNTDSLSAKNEVEIGEIETRTEQLKLINKYYPSLTEKQISELEEKIRNLGADTHKKGLEADVLVADKIIKDAEANHASELYHWKVEYEKAHTQEAKDAASASAARAAWDIFEKQWTESHSGARPSSSGILAIAAAVADFLGVSKNNDSEVNVVGDVIKDKAQEIHDLMHDPSGTVKKKGKEIDDKLVRWKERGKRFVKNAWRGYYPYMN